MSDNTGDDNAGSGGITFRGTLNSELASYDLEPYIWDLTYETIGDILRLAPAYKTIYRPEIDPFVNGEYIEFYEVPNVEIIKGSLLQADTPTLSTHQGIVGTVLTAFNTHHNLQLRPDDIWISILAQFAAYVNGRAEELRSRIVDFEGQQALQVISPGDVYTANLGGMITAFMDEISRNILDPTLKDWFLPGYTTTTRTDEICAAAMAMCSFQKYFTYEFGMICGIPEVTLLGTVDDWRRLRQKVERLVEFDDADKLMSEVWVPILREILDNFVESAKNGSKNNLAFWNQIVSNTGDKCGDPHLLTGWISAFSVFNEHGEFYAEIPDTGDDSTIMKWPVIGLDDIYHNVASCPATVDDNGKLYNATLFVGQMAYEFAIDEAATETLPEAVTFINTSDGYMRKFKPRNDWALVLSDGFVQVPTESLEEEMPPDGTWTHGGFCLLDPYVHSNGTFYDPPLDGSSSPTIPDVPPSSHISTSDSTDSSDESPSLDLEDSRSSNASLKQSNSGLSSGQKAGVSVAAIVGSILFVLWFLIKRRSRSSSSGGNTSARDGGAIASNADDDNGALEKPVTDTDKEESSEQPKNQQVSETEEEEDQASAGDNSKEKHGDITITATESC